MNSRLIRVKRRSAVLRQAAVSCFKGIPSINVTAGCLHGCAYCYARGFANAPPAGEVYAYENLGQMLEEELRRKKRLPAWVSFSTASDPFQNAAEVLDISYRVMSLMLSRSIGVSFLSKGVPPDPFLDLFGRHRESVRARIGLSTVDDEYCRRFEIRAARPKDRLTFARRLKAVGVETAIRMDPLIHGLNDSTCSLEATMEAIAATEVRSVSISYLYLRPSLMRPLASALGPAEQKVVFGPYETERPQQVITSRNTRLLPKQLRVAQYARIKEIALRHDIRASVCGCKNPDLPWEDCSPVSYSSGVQLPLFSIPAAPSADREG